MGVGVLFSSLYFVFDFPYLTVSCLLLLALLSLVVVVGGGVVIVGILDGDGG